MFHPCRGWRGAAPLPQQPWAWGWVQILGTRGVPWALPSADGFKSLFAVQTAGSCCVSIPQTAALLDLIPGTECFVIFLFVYGPLNLLQEEHKFPCKVNLRLLTVTLIFLVIFFQSHPWPRPSEHRADRSCCFGDTSRHFGMLPGFSCCRDLIWRLSW